MCAQKAGMSANTARKYLRQDNVTEQKETPHTWRTRADPLVAIWAEAARMLRDAPELEAKALFEHLSQRHPGAVKSEVLRTFQRRVRKWRLAEGPEKEVFFTQNHEPGKVLAIDWTDMNSLKITIAGRTFDHKLFHAVLPYSNWEWAVRARSESTLSLRSGLRAAFDHLERRSPTTADRRYLEILKVAADEGQMAVQNALEQLLGAARREVSADRVREMLETWRDLQREWRERPAMAVDLRSYDDLLDGCEPGRSDFAENANEEVAR